MKEFLEKYSKIPSGLFKHLLILFLFGGIPFLAIQIILNANYLWPVTLNGEDVYGIRGIIVLIILAPFVALLFASITWLYLLTGILIIRILKKIIYG